LAHHTDDGFNEIQLNGKQLVFLFMAVTVASVVIFLCGVLVGRGVRAERAAADALQALAEVPSADVRAPSEAAQTRSADADPTKAAPPPAVDDLSYFDRLEKPNPSTEALEPAKKADKPDRDPEPPVAAPRPRPATEPVAPAATKASAEALPSGYVVQIAALNARGEADAVANRLASKGYSAYVLATSPKASSPGTQSVYRVRVGPFKTRRDAESMADRLEKEEQIKRPWITR